MTMAHTGATAVPGMRGLRLWRAVLPAVCRRVHSPGVGGVIQDEGTTLARAHLSLHVTSEVSVVALGYGARTL
jgi:hypothetical protein